MPLLSDPYNTIESIPLTEVGSTPATPPTGKWRIYAKSDGVYVVDDAGNETGPFGSGGGGTYYYILIRDEKAQNTAGGTFTAGAWLTRDLNTEVVDTGNHAALASNQITLEAGTYRAHIFAPAYACDPHQARLYNISDSAVVLLGTTMFCQPTAGGMNHSVITGRFTLAAQKVLEVQHYCIATKTTNGYGVQGNITTEIYTTVELWREPD